MVVVVVVVVFLLFFFLLSAWQAGLAINRVSTLSRVVFNVREKGERERGGMKTNMADPNQKRRKKKTESKQQKKKRKRRSSSETNSKKRKEKERERQPKLRRKNNCDTFNQLSFFPLVLSFFFFYLLLYILIHFILPYLFFPLHSKADMQNSSCSSLSPLLLVSTPPYQEKPLKRSVTKGKRQRYIKTKKRKTHTKNK